MLDRRGVSRRHTFLVIRAVKGPRRESFELSDVASPTRRSRCVPSEELVRFADEAKRVLSTMLGRS
jgi:hypothetical protein